MMTKKLLLASSLFCVAAQASQSWTDTAISWTKGAAAAFVTGCSSKSGLEYVGSAATSSGSARFTNAMRALGYSYAVSKIAPYSRDCFNIKSPKLLDDTHPIAKDRKRAFFEALTRGCVAVPCVTEAYKLLTENFSYVSIGKLCGMGYTLYHALPYVYKNSRVALAI